MSKERLLTYAYDKGGNLIHIDSVENGNNCGCTCPHCKEPLCAKNRGEIQTHHFSHQSGTDCEGAYETAVHLLAKKILVECKKLRVFYDNGERETLDLEEAIPEYYDKETGLTPDIFAKSNGNILWIEFKKTHAVDRNKIKKVQEKAIDCIEIDINALELDESTIKSFLIEYSYNKKWIYSKRNEELRIEKEKQDKERLERNIIRIIKERINTQLWLAIPVNNASCERYDECPLANDRCTNQKNVTIDLAFYDYNKCYEDVYMDEKKSIKSDLQLSRNKPKKEENQNERINIILPSNDNYEKTTNTETKKIIKLRREDIFNIEYMLREHNILKITNINDVIGFNIDQVPPKFLDITVRKLVAYKNGHLFLEKGHSPCHDCYDKKEKESVLFSLFINKNYKYEEEYRRLALLYCHKKGYKIRYCELCCFSFRDNGYSLRCKRYQTKGTPHFPMQEKDANKVINCPWYRLDKTLNIKEEDFKFIKEHFNQ